MGKITEKNRNAGLKGKSKSFKNRQQRSKKEKGTEKNKEDAALKERHQRDKMKIINILHGNFFAE